jgi:hypothetical protein
MYASDAFEFEQNHLPQPHWMEPIHFQQGEESPEKLSAMARRSSAKPFQTMEPTDDLISHVNGITLADIPSQIYLPRKTIFPPCSKPSECQSNIPYLCDLITNQFSLKTQVPASHFEKSAKILANWNFHPNNGLGRHGQGCKTPLMPRNDPWFPNRVIPETNRIPEFDQLFVPIPENLPIFNFRAGNVIQNKKNRFAERQSQKFNSTPPPGFHWEMIQPPLAHHIVFRPKITVPPKSEIIARVNNGILWTRPEHSVKHIPKQPECVAVPNTFP